ncbi:hypothetical protein [Paraglaciecola sp. MB-3u-78]|jgi:hypothetical protein|uniref:hypothetical protein n=1 Tax=Paraglaciecola sp. MB-3u-78 TaxID=2058332 RepID=UPI000C3231BB|nr:hypothetical protein [Paraglaciecola sp. MB-3u-78]PKG97186.1 hypothetical protein CXF95_21590 [Paraglaciecola sp. MB-3u-78]
MINIEIDKKIDEVINLRCVRQAVGNSTSLSLGFGKKDNDASTEKYREWEIGTYSSNWRVIKNKQVICASLDDVETNEELDAKLKNISFGSIRSVSQNEVGDVTLFFDNSVLVEFICLSDEDDEMFHVFCPNSEYIEYNPCSGWKTGRSDSPW